MDKVMLTRRACAMERNQSRLERCASQCEELSSAAARYAGVSFKLNKCPSELVLTKCLLPGSFYPTEMFYFDLLLSMAMTLEEKKKKKKYRSTHFFWPYSHQMSSTYTILQPCHIPRAYTWPCLLTFPEKTHKFSGRLKPDKWSTESVQVTFSQEPESMVASLSIHH